MKPLKGSSWLAKTASILVLAVTLLATGCATIKHLTEDPEMERIKGQAQSFKSSPFYGPGLQALKQLYPKEDPAELLFTLAKYVREERDDKRVDALTALKLVAAMELPVAEALVKSGKIECEKDRVDCLDLREFEESRTILEKCIGGDGKTCALRSIETQPLFPIKAVYFAKLACVNGNPAGCELMRADHESKERAKDRSENRAVYIWVHQY